MTCFRMPNGQTLHKWCQQNDKNYRKISQKMRKGMDIEEALYGYKKVRNIQHYYKGKPLADLCGGTQTLKYQRIMRYYYLGFGLDYAIWKEQQVYGEKTDEK